jgi:kynurenine formamidase
MRLIDLSVTIEQDAVSELVPPKIEFRSHEGAGLDFFKQAFGLEEKDLVYSGGTAPGDEIFTFMSHTGTHVDAPFHYAPRSADGSPAPAIDELPLDWFFGDAVVLDLRHLQPRDLIEVHHLEAALAAIDYRLKPHDIVLLHTGTDKKLHSKEYFEQPGMGRESTLWLVQEQGIRVIGIDAFGFDRPFAAMREDFERTGDGRFIWPAHFAGIEAPYCQIEKLANLDALPRAHGFQVACFPIKVKHASAGFARVVAFVEDDA